MTWVPVEVGRQPERDRVLNLKPDVHDAFREILEVSWQITDPGLLDLCRLRLAQLMRARAELAGASEERLAELRDWDSSPAFTDRERAALSFAEQYQVDHHLIGEEQKGELAGYLSQGGMVNFVWALHMNDAYIRMLSLLDIEPDPSAAPPRVERDPATGEAGSHGRELPTAAGTDPGEVVDLRDPAFVDAYYRLGRATARQSLVDDLTSEAVRLRNASFQGCQY